MCACIDRQPVNIKTWHTAGWQLSLFTDLCMKIADLCSCEIPEPENDVEDTSNYHELKFLLHRPKKTGDIMHNLN